MGNPKRCHCKASKTCIVSCDPYMPVAVSKICRPSFLRSVKQVFVSKGLQPVTLKQWQAR